MKTLRALLALLGGAMLWSCSNSDTVDGPVAMSAYQVVTFEGNGSDGAVFTFYPQGSATMTTLTAKGSTLDEQTCPPPCRVIIGYVPESGDPAATGTISLFAAGAVYNGKVQTFPTAKVDALATVPIYLDAIWPDGDWINMRLQLPYVDTEHDPQVLALVADESTLGTDTVRCRLVNQLPEGVTIESTYLQNGYVSYDATELRRRHAKAVCIELNNATLPHNTSYTVPLLPLQK